MGSYVIRLDDAAPKRDVVKWDRMEALLDKYDIKPLVGVIPDCKDPQFECYNEDEEFWEKVSFWKSKGWEIALHGYQHVFFLVNGGINPVGRRSEFVGLSLKQQKEKIKAGVAILNAHGLDPKVFFAPGHTFDYNTIEALLSESNIRCISDTIASKPYNKWGMTFIPQQCGKVRRLPFHIVTFCYHPNRMSNAEFDELEKFLIKYQKKFICIPSGGGERERNHPRFVLQKNIFWDKRL